MFGMKRQVRGNYLGNQDLNIPHVVIKGSMLLCFDEINRDPGEYDLNQLLGQDQTLSL